MKRTVGVLLLGSFFLHAEQQQPIFYQVHPPQAAQMLVQFYPNHTNHNSNITEQHPTIDVKTDIAQKQETTQIVSTPVPTQFETARATLESVWHSAKHYLKEHWLFCSITTACAAYGMLLSYLLYARYRIRNSHRWSNWQIHLTVEQLMQQTDAQLKVLLIKDIASYYINPQNPTDSLWPLTQFLIAIKEEEKALNRYLSIAGFIQKTPFYRIFPALYHDYAREALTRLTFVYHLFASWSADITWEQLHKIN
jgi:hypothetical protein